VVYAFDADTQQAALWSVNLVPNPTVNHPKQSNESNGGDTKPDVGCAATPVIDMASETIYCLANFRNVATGTTDATDGRNYELWLHALNIKTGQERPGSPVRVNPTFTGHGNQGNAASSDLFTDGTKTAYTFDALSMHARPSLVLSPDGIVYLSFSSHSDGDPYHGIILGYDKSSLALVRQFNASPNEHQAGIWMGAATPAIDEAGNIYVVTGNGPFDAAGNAASPTKNWGESVLKFPANNLTISRQDSLSFFTPWNWDGWTGSLNNYDMDLGAGGITLLPDLGGTQAHHKLMVVGGKAGMLYVIDRSNLGGYTAPTVLPPLNKPQDTDPAFPQWQQDFNAAYTANANTDKVVQEINEPNQKRIFCTPAYFNNAIYYAPEGAPLTQRIVGYNAVNGKYVTDDPGTYFQSAENFGAGHGATPFISANGTANGIVWVYDTAGGNGCRLFAYNATNVSSPRLCALPLSGPGGVSIKGPQFGTLTVANGKAYIPTSKVPVDNNLGDSTGYLVVCGQPPTPEGSPAAPSGVQAQGSTATSIVVSWTDNSTDETGFNVYRSTTGNPGSFALVGSSPTTGPNLTSYSDDNLTAGTTYYYQVKAKNSLGESNALATASSTTFPYLTDPGLLAYWNLDDLGIYAADATPGNLHRGDVLGEGQWDGGVIGGSRNFHGTNSTGRIKAANPAAQNGNHADLRFTAGESFTVATWIYVTTPANGQWRTAVAKSRNNGNYYGIYLNPTGNIVFRGAAAGKNVVGP
ncbi:MAG: fibronectin type III domain-containing protein, partial [Chthoniobacterales bacterium]